MKNLPISKFYPELIHLRIYLYQLINDNFGISENIRNSLIESFGGDSLEIIDTLTFEDLELLLPREYFPDSLFVFKNKNEETPAFITQLPPDLSLTILLHKCKENDIELPKLYTGIKQVSFENGGLLVMINYNTQIYSCCTSSGEDLLVYSHDCDLGYNGLVLSRGSSSSQMCYGIFQWDGTDLKHLESFWPSEHPEIFPHLDARDIIPEMLTDQEHIIDYYPEVEYKTEDDIYQLLTNVSGAFRVLVPEYSNNQKLALAAVQSNKLAFTFLSEDLRRSISFVKMLFKHLSNPNELYSYLDADIQKDPEIISKVYRQYPKCLKHVNSIEDGEMIINLFKDNFYDVGKYISLLSESLKNDHNFLLQLAKINWEKLLEYSPALYTNIEFIEKLIINVNEHLENTNKQLKSKENKPPIEIKDPKKSALARGIRNLLESVKLMPINKNFEEEVYAYILALPEGIKLLEKNKDLLNKLSFEFIISKIPRGHISSALKLKGLTSLSDAAVESLSKHKGNLDLSGLASLSDTAAESLSKHEGNLNLSSLTSLSDTAAESLSKYKSYLNLSGLTSLSDAAAESFSNQKGNLNLSGLTSLSDAAAESFSKREGDLYFNGLISLSDAAAESLSKHKGDLILSGLTSLSDTAAESLSKHKSNLNLSGLISLSDAAAESLSKHRGYLLNLSGLTSLSDAATEFLNRTLEDDLPF